MDEICSMPADVQSPLIHIVYESYSETKEIKSTKETPHDNEDSGQAQERLNTVTLRAALDAIIAAGTLGLCAHISRLPQPDIDEVRHRLFKVHENRPSKSLKRRRTTYQVTRPITSISSHSRSAFRVRINLNH